MKLHLAILATVLLFTACTQNISDTDVDNAALTLSQLRKVTAADTKGTTLLIDARTPGEYSAGHIPGAANLSVAQVSGVEGATDPRLLRYKTLIVYGNDPASITAKSLGKRLIATGYKDVRFFPEGFAGWQSAGLPIEKPPAR
ncbi:MAG TPA: rhodanese-like domain-containing protein [Phycisphaerales bacterium]|nr:rhodanese-like domain-containing protein [Phycisphaerales bacterium]